MAVLRRGALKKRTRTLAVEREAEHLLPVRAVTGFGHRVVALTRAGKAARDVARVRGDLRRDDPLAHIVLVRQARCR